MATVPSYPGVYVQELPSGVRTIAGVATSIAMFIGRAKTGPVNTPVACQGFPDFVRTFSDDDAGSDLRRAVKLFFLNGGAQCQVMRLAQGAASSAVTLRNAADTADAMRVAARSPGAFGDSIRLTVSHQTPAPDSTFNLEVFRELKDASGALQRVGMESYTALSMDPTDPRHAPRIVNPVSLLIELTDPSAAAAAAVSSPAPGSYALGSGSTAPHQTGGTAGNDGVTPVPGDYDAAYQAIDGAVDLFNLLVLPKDHGHPEATTRSLWAAASSFCQKRRAFLVMDPPESWRDARTATDPVGGVSAMRAGLVSDHAAVFFPRLRMSENGQDVLVGPSGAIAGLMARIDTTRGVWKSPAGTDAGLHGITGLEFRFSDADSGVMNPRAVNSLRVFPSGIVNWGARTMDGDDSIASSFKYISVRRLAFFIEESLCRGLAWAAFETDDERLWAQLRLNAGTFMQALFRQGALLGRTASEAWFVKCDASTTTESDRHSGIVNIEVGFAPLKPAEFVMLKLQLKAGQAET